MSNPVTNIKTDFTLKHYTTGASGSETHHAPIITLEDVTANSPVQTTLIPGKKLEASNATTGAIQISSGAGIRFTSANNIVDPSENKAIEIYPNSTNANILHIESLQPKTNATTIVIGKDETTSGKTANAPIISQGVYTENETDYNNDVLNLQGELGIIHQNNANKDNVPLLSQGSHEETDPQTSATSVVYDKEVFISGDLQIGEGVSTTDPCKITLVPLNDTTEPPNIKAEQIISGNLDVKGTYDPNYDDSNPENIHSTPAGVQFSHDAGFHIPNPNYEQGGQEPETINVRISDLYSGSGNLSDVVRALCRIVYNESSNLATEGSDDVQLVRNFADAHN